MAITELVHTTPVGGANGATAGPIDTRTATLIVIGVVYLGSVTISDSLDNVMFTTNTWTPLTAYSSTTQICRFYYCLLPNTGATHYFRVAGTGVFASISAKAFTATKTTGTQDGLNGNNNNSAATSLATNSATISEDGEVIIALLGNNATSSTPTISAVNGQSFGTVDYVNFGSGANFGLAMAALVQTSKANANPTWTFSSSPQCAASIVSFKAPASTPILNTSRILLQSIPRSNRY